MAECGRCGRSYLLAHLTLGETGELLCRPCEERELELELGAGGCNGVGKSGGGQPDLSDMEDDGYFWERGV